MVMSIIIAFYGCITFIAIMYLGTEIIERLDKIIETLKGENCDDEEISDS